MRRVYPINSTITFATTFLDPQTQQPKNPSTVIFKLKDPNGVVSTPAVSSPSVGVFVAQYVPTVSGMWASQWQGIGTVQTVVEGRFEVEPTAFP